MDYKDILNGKDFCEDKKASLKHAQRVKYFFEKDQERELVFYIYYYLKPFSSEDLKMQKKSRSIEKGKKRNSLDSLINLNHGGRQLRPIIYLIIKGAEFQHQKAIKASKEQQFNFSSIQRM